MEFHIITIDHLRSFMTLLLGTGILKPKKVMWSRKGPLAFLFPCGLLPPLPCLAAPFPSGFPDAHQLGVVTVAVVKPFTLLESYSLLSQGASPWPFLTFSLPSTSVPTPSATTLGVMLSCLLG